MAIYYPQQSSGGGNLINAIQLWDQFFGPTSKRRKIETDAAKDSLEKDRAKQADDEAYSWVQSNKTAASIKPGTLYSELTDPEVAAVTLGFKGKPEAIAPAWNKFQQQVLTQNSIKSSQEAAQAERLRQEQEAKQKADLLANEQQKTSATNLLRQKFSATRTQDESSSPYEFFNGKTKPEQWSPPEYARDMAVHYSKLPPVYQNEIDLFMKDKGLDPTESSDVWNKVVANLTGIPDLPQGMVGGPVTLGPKGEQVNRTATPVQADQEAQKAAETEKLDKQRTAVAKFNESVNTNFETRKLIESGSAFNQMKSQVAAANAAAAEEKKDPKNKSGMQGGYDVAIIKLFNIALEPNSVVRDAEYETARKSGGIVASAINMIENLRTGQVLTPEQRAMLLNAAQQLVEGRLSSHNKYLEMRKRGEIDTLGLPKELADTIQPWKMDDLTTYDHPLARLGFRGNKYGSPTLGRSTDPIVLPSALNKEQIGVYGQVLRKYADQTKDNVYVVDPETGSLLEIAPTTPPAPPAPPTQPGPVAPSYPRPIGPPTQEEKKAGDWADVMRMIPTNPTLLF